MAARGGSARPEHALPQGRLWAPWRAAYLYARRPSTSGCIFCFRQLSARDRRHRLVLYQGALAVVMLNAYPYNGGHLMVAPRRHLASPELLSKAERATLGELLAVSVACLKRVFKPAGFNLGANLGRSAGAGFAGHLHWHVVPRFVGDNNFMPVLASTRVLSEHLSRTFRRLEPHFQELDAALF